MHRIESAFFFFFVSFMKQKLFLFSSFFFSVLFCFAVLHKDLMFKMISDVWQQIYYNNGTIVVLFLFCNYTIYFKYRLNLIIFNDWIIKPLCHYIRILYVINHSQIYRAALDFAYSKTMHKLSARLHKITLNACGYENSSFFFLDSS